MFTCKQIKAIFKIGNNMVSCKEKCHDVTNDKSCGVIPRCIYLESNGKIIPDVKYGNSSTTENNDPGCIIVGINPGQGGGNGEFKFYLTKRCTYESTVEWFNKNPSVFANKLRGFLKSLEFEDILWTELAKCQTNKSISNGNIPSIQTLGHCAKKFLQFEIAALPENWLIFAVGRITFDAMSLLYPKRAIIGIPHPTGSFSSFSRVSKHDNLKEIIHTALEEKRAIWLK
jgi:hypothetical protein